MPNERICAVIVCAGKGERTGLHYNKILYAVGTETVLDLTLQKFVGAGITDIVLVSSREDADAIKSIAATYPVNCCVTEGGTTRTTSVLNGLNAAMKVFDGVTHVVIHDGARPFASSELIKRCVRSAVACGSGVAAVKCVDSVRIVSSGKTEPLPREMLYNVQTPQAFEISALVKGYELADGSYTDDAQIYELTGNTVTLVDGEYANIKITTAADLYKLPSCYKVGAGFDLHRTQDGLPLILGGVRIEHSAGLVGHSDADVLTHAIIDSLLSAADLPDIGVLFPDTDPKYKGISSVTLLLDVVERLRQKGYRIHNVSAVVIAQRPKLSSHIPQIKQSLADALGVQTNDVNVSAKTAELLGDIGAGRAIATTAACTLTEGK